MRFYQMGKKLPKVTSLCNVVFDIKMKNFRHMARLVAQSHRSEAPATIKYVIDMSSETARIDDCHPR